MSRGKTVKRPSTRLRDFVTTTVCNSPSPSSSSPVPSLSSGTPYLLAHYVNCDNFLSRHETFLVAIRANVEVISFKEAMRDERWKEAMKAEIRALEDNDTWELVSLPSNKNVLGCRWVYKIKYHSDGSIERLKAILVVFGNHQVEGLDYRETFTLVVKMVTIHTFSYDCCSKIK